MLRLPAVFALYGLVAGCATAAGPEESNPNFGGNGGLQGIGATGATGSGGSSTSGGSGGQGAHPSGTGASSSGGAAGAGAGESGGSGGDLGGAAGAAATGGADTGGTGGGGSGGTGGGTGATNACCDTSLAPGCKDAAVQKCVCNQDAWCCTNEWDDMCVGEVDSFGCGSCSGGTGGTGGTGGSGGSGGSSSTCPTNGPPPGPYTMRFDTATLNCGSSGVCTSADAKCFCQQDFDKLDVSPSHLMGVGTDQHKSQIWAAGNFQAVYVNELNVNISLGGAQRAADVIAKAKQDFPCGVPSWFIVNEISAGLWPTSSSYRQFVIDFAKAMKNTYGKKAIIAAPFATPGANAASWTALQQYAYIGAEVYLPGEKVNANGNSVAWCQAQYQASINAYGALGVPKGRLMLFEHFGNTKSGTGWGRSGSSVSGWHNAIKARAQAIKNLGFAGFLSYGWANNDMAATESDRLAFMATYNSISLP